MIDISALRVRSGVSTSSIRPTSGQAMVEFSMVIGVFLMALFAAVSASLYTVQRSAAVTAVAAGARAAASAQPGDPNSPDLAAAGDAVRRVTAHSMFGTRVDVQQLAAGDHCESHQPGGAGAVVVCVQRVSSGTGAGLDMVSVRMLGKPSNPVGIPLYGVFAWKLDVAASVHQVTFNS
jgi:Flp pilus assembly protein TadG